MTDTPDYAALCAQMAAALEECKKAAQLLEDLSACGADDEYTAALSQQIALALAAWRASSPDPVYAEARNMFEALEFYADPEIYKPHPHGSAFDKRAYLNFSAEAIVNRINRARREG